MQIYLTDQTRQRLEQLATLHNTSMSGVIKLLVDADWQKISGVYTLPAEKAEAVQEPSK